MSDAIDSAIDTKSVEFDSDDLDEMKIMKLV